MDLSRFSNDELQALKVQDFSKLSDSNLAYVKQNLDFFDEEPQQPTESVEPEKQGIMGSFAGGIGKTLLGAGETLGIVEPETYAKYAEGFKEDERQNPIASGLGKGVGVMVGALPAMAVANPIGAGALAIGGAATMGGTSRRAEVMHDTGGDTEAANSAGLSEAFWSGAGVALPVSLAGNLLKRLVTGGAGNIAFNELDIAHQNQILKEYPTLQSPNFDLKSMTVSGVLGAVTGGVFGKRAGVAPAAKGDVEGKELPPQELGEGEVPANRGSKEIYESTKLNAEKEIARSEYLIGKIEQDLKEKTFETLAEAEQYKKAKLEEVQNIQKDIMAHEETLSNAEALLRGEEPVLPKQTDMPSSLPPRPEGDFVRPNETPTGQDVNGNMFDTVDRTQDMLPEDSTVRQDGPTINPTAIKEEIGTEVPTRVEEAPTETIEITAPVDTRPIGELDIDTVNDRLATARDLVDSGEMTNKEFMELLQRRNELEESAEGIFGPQPQVLMRGGSKSLRNAITAMLERVGLNKERLDIDLNNGTVHKKGGFGQAYAEGNTGKIDIAPPKTFKQLLNESPRLQKILDGIPKEQIADFERLVTISHEIGHMLLFKLVQTDVFKGDLDALVKEFDAWKVKEEGTARAQGQLFRRMAAKDQNYYLQFAEFFAQRVARALTMTEHAPTNVISKFISKFKDIVNTLRNEFKVSLVANNIVDDLISKIITSNKELLDQTGKNIFEIESTRSLESAVGIHNKRYDYKPYESFTGVGMAAPNMKADSGVGDRFSPAFRGPPTVHTVAVHNVEDINRVVEQQRHVPDINPAGVGTVGRIVSGAMLKGSNWIFGIQQKAQLFKNSPLVKYSSDVILNAIHTQTSRSMELLTGAPSRAAWNGKRQKSHMISLQKVIDGDSPTVVFDKSSNEDFHAVHQLLEQGMGKYSYEETLAKLGGDLTPQQRLLYETATKMYAKMYKMAEESAQRLGKKSMIPNMKGWYPAMRKGEFTVNFRVKGLNRVAGRDDLGRAIMTDLVHSQSFRTKGEAQAFLDHFEKQSSEFKGRLEHDGIQQYKDADMPNNMSDFMEAYKQQRNKLDAEIKKALYDPLSETSRQREVAWEVGIDKRAVPSWLREELDAAEGDIQKVLDGRMQRLTDMYIARGGTLGAHHRLRTNVSGSMGSEMFATTHDAGKAFRDANFKSVDEYTSLMMKMEIEEKLNLVLDKPDFRESHPNTLEVVTLMRDYALNKVESPMQMKGFKAAVDAVWEAAWDKGIAKPLGFIGAKKYHDAPTIDLALGKFSHFFYIHALMSRPAFWAAQGVQFLWAGRTMVKDNVGPVGAMTAAGKGMWSVLHPDKAFLEALFEVSQTSHTFSPQFINDLNKFGLTDFMKTGGKGKLVLDLITGEKMATAADTFSRLMTFGMMYEHFKAKGLEGSDLAQSAARATDENMVQYGRQYKAPVFQKMGVVGDLTSPLQTFSQAALGNIISDFSDIVRAPGGRAKLKASLPFMATMAITSLMAGVIGAPLVAEYEALRLLFNATWRKLGGNDDLLPSVVDLVLQGDNDFSHRVLSHGLIGASTMPATDGQGLDIAASNRWQPLWGGIFTGEKTFMEAIPVINFMLDRLDDTTAILKDASGITKMTQAESRTHRLGIVPGMYKGFVDDLLFNAKDREFVPTNKGQAFVPQTDTERAAKYLGTSTITSSTARLRERRTREQEMRDQVIIDKQIELMTDDVLKGNMDSVRERAMKLAQDYQMESDQIERRIESSIFKRKVPSGVRQFVGKGGTSSTQQQKRYQHVEETYGEPQQFNYEDQ